MRQRLTEAWEVLTLPWRSVERGASLLGGRRQGSGMGPWSRVCTPAGRAPRQSSLSGLPVRAGDVGSPEQLGQARPRDQLSCGTYHLAKG